VDFRKLEPTIKNLQKLFEANPEYFNIPEFALKIY